MPDHLNLPTTINTSHAKLPETYEAAKTALSKCTRVDECKTWTDKALALASYAKQADDETLYKLAKRIQYRAVRRCGELMKPFQAPGERTDQPSVVGGTRLGHAPDCPTQRQAAEEAGLSKRQEVQASKLAKIPQDQFDAAVDGDNPPSSIQSFINTASGNERKFAKATHLIGAVRRFAEFCESNDAVWVAGGVMPREVEEIRRQVGQIDSWLDVFVVNMKD